MQEVIINGRSVGDSSVGINGSQFTIHTGINIDDLDDNLKEFIHENIIYNMWQLHDNGNINYHFEHEKKHYRFTYNDSLITK